MFVLVIFVVFLTILCIKYKSQRRRLCSLVDKFDGPKPLPLLGHAHMVVTRSQTERFHLMREYCAFFPDGQPLRIWLFHKPYIIIRRQEEIQAVSKVTHKDLTYRFMVDVIGDGLISSHGERWRESRKVIEPVLNTSVLWKHYSEIFTRHTNRLMDALKHVEADRTIDIFPYIFKSVICSINETTTGSHDDLNDELREYIQENEIAEIIFKRVVFPILHPNLIFNAFLYVSGCKQKLQRLSSYVMEVIRGKAFAASRNDSSNVSSVKGNSVIEAMLPSHVSKTQNIVEEVITLLFAGSETTVVTICFTLLMLAQHEDIQEQVLHELQKIFDRSNRTPTMTDLSRMTFLEQCIKETLRKFSTVPVVLRSVTEDVSLPDGRIIPAGANLFISIYDIHHDTRYYSDPEIWNPRNFDPEKIKNRPLNSFIPFGIGPRFCVGYKYAMMSMKLILSSILREFKLTTNTPEYTVNIGFVYRSETGYNIQLRRRSEIR